MTAPAMPSRQGRAYRQGEIEDLLRDALSDLLRDGTAFRDVSVERLCTAAGIARSTFYLYFSDKWAMLHALTAGTMLRLYEAQRGWLDKGKASTLTDVRTSMRALFAAFRTDEAGMRAVHEASVYEGSLRAQYVDAVTDYARAVERYIRTGQEGGWVRDLHPAATATALVWMVERTVFQVGSTTTAHKGRVQADALADVIWTTLRT